MSSKSSGGGSLKPPVAVMNRYGPHSRNNSSNAQPTGSGVDRKHHTLTDSKSIGSMSSGGSGGGSVSGGVLTAAADEASAEASYMLDLKLLAEYQQLSRLAPDGIYVLPAVNTHQPNSSVSGSGDGDSNLRRWFGIMFVNAGMWRGGIFKFIFDIPPNYPAAPPLVRFLSPPAVFHPLIDMRTGRVDLSQSPALQIAGEHSIVLVLSYLRKIFYLSDYWTVPVGGGKLLLPAAGGPNALAGLKLRPVPNVEAQHL